MVLAALPIRKLHVSGRSRQHAGFSLRKHPVSSSLHSGLSPVGYDFALANGDELVSYTVQKPRHSAVRYYTHSNSLYSIAATTNAAGSVVERYSYNAYGRQAITSATGATRSKSAVGFDGGFTGFVADYETGLLHARTRMYSPNLGRFIARDMVKQRYWSMRPSPLDGYVDGYNLYVGYFIPNTVDPLGEACPTNQECFNKLNCEETGPPEIFIGGWNVPPFVTATHEYDVILQGTNKCPDKCLYHQKTIWCECGYTYDQKRYIPAGGLLMNQLVKGLGGNLGILGGSALQGALNVSSPHGPVYGVTDSTSVEGTCECAK